MLGSSPIRKCVGTRDTKRTIRDSKRAWGTDRSGHHKSRVRFGNADAAYGSAYTRSRQPDTADRFAYAEHEFAEWRLARDNAEPFKRHPAIFGCPNAVTEFSFSGYAKHSPLNDNPESAYSELTSSVAA